MANTHTLSRRAFGIAMGALVVEFSLGTPAAIARTLAAAAPDEVEMSLGAWIAVAEDGRVTLFTGKVELGQGIATALAQIACDELDLRIDQLKVVQGDTRSTPDQGLTWGQLSIVRAGPAVRVAAATARLRLLELAAKEFDTDLQSLALDAGVIGAPDGRRASFAQLVAGQRLAGPVDPKAPTKPASQYRLVGKSIQRVDIPAKVSAKFHFVQDVKVPGMLHGRVVRGPRLGATVSRLDSAAAARVPGFVQVVRIKDFIGVLARTEWAAIQAAQAIDVEWSGGQTMPTTDTVYEQLLQTPVAQVQELASVGDAESAMRGTERVFEGTYEMPYQTHGSIGPSCAVADVRSDLVTVWSASQGPHWLRDNLADLLQVPDERVHVIYVEGAGCYGRNGHDDVAGDAVLLSRAAGVPVRVQWMRDQEHGHAPMGPAHVVKVRAALREGRVQAWRSDGWITEQPKALPPVQMPGFRSAGFDQIESTFAGFVHSNQQPGYAIPNQKVIAHRVATRPVRVSWIRGPGRIHNVFAVESMMDEMAVAIGKDPVAFRLEHSADPRGRNVIERVARLADWRPRTTRAAQRSGIGALEGRGFAYARYSNNSTYVAMVADVTVERDSGEVRLKRVFVSHDCGRMVNPDGVLSQVQGCVNQTASRALLEEMAFDGLQATSTNWATYPIFRFKDMPELQIDLVESQEPSMGAGEASTAPVVAAIANAIQDATGARLRRIPFAAARVKAAMSQDKA